MQLTEAFNGGAHGNVHGILGGTWSPEADKYASATPNIVIPFVHHAYVSEGGDHTIVRARERLT